MKNLFDKDTHTETINRLNTLTPQTQRLWGKMNVAQMLAHCKAAFTVPLSDKKMPRSFMGLLIGWMIKNKLHNDDPWKRNLPTAPNFIIKDERDFEKEKQELVAMINQFNHAGPGMLANIRIPCLVHLHQSNGVKVCTNM